MSVRYFKSINGYRDSYIDFEPDWNALIKKILKDTNNEYAILSTYIAN